MGDSVTDDPRRPSNDGLQSGPPSSGVAYAAKWRTCPSVGCYSATGCACAPSAPSLPTGMGFWSRRSGTWPHGWEAVQFFLCSACANLHLHLRIIANQ